MGLLLLFFVVLGIHRDFSWQLAPATPPALTEHLEIVMLLLGCL